MKLLFWSTNPRELKRLFLVIWLLLAWTAPAAQVKLDSLVVGGRTYTNVTVLTYNTTHVFFTYEGGSASVKLRDLEPELQKRFNYDPAAAAEAEKQQAADEARYQGSIAVEAWSTGPTGRPGRAESGRHLRGQPG